jgi:MscS family membrane protein
MWLIESLPESLRAIGPRGLAWWQWLALPVVLVVAWTTGAVLARFTRSLLVIVVRRTKVSWDDEVVSSLGGPLVLAWGVLASRALLSLLMLPDRAEAWAGKALRTVMFMAFFWLVLRLVTFAGQLMTTSTWALSRPASRSLVPLAARILQVGVLAMAVVAVLADLGYPVASLVAGLGIGGLALALAGQKTVENLFGAFSLGVDQPFRVGDFINVEGLVMGTVEVIGLRSTRIRTPDRTMITMPNGKLADMRIETFASRDRIRFATTLGLSRLSRAGQVRQVLAEVEKLLSEHPKLFPGSVTVRLKDITPSSLDVEVQAYFGLTDFGEFQTIRQELLLAFMEVVEKAGTGFALPTRAMVQLHPGSTQGPSSPSPSSSSSSPTTTA